MKTKLLSLIISIVSLFVFNLLFWQESIGQNLFYFSLILCGISIINKSHPITKEALYAFTAVVISGTMVILHNSGLSITMLFISTMIFLGFQKQTTISTVWEAWIGFLVNYLTQAISYLRSLSAQKSKSPTLNFFYSFFKLGIIPLLLFFLFFMIYRGANPKFEALSQSFYELIASLFVNFSFVHALFLLFGLSFIALAIKKKHINLPAFVSLQDELKRPKRTIRKGQQEPQTSLFGELINEYKIGLLVLGTLNLLLLVVNIIDMEWIWFGFEVPLDFNLKQFVHEGTYLLILSILISIGIVLYFFRGSLNFYPKNKALLILGKAWIIQNVVLTISVFLRNYHYIDYHGLAGKRIGVIIFLSMVLFGLATLFYKVLKRKTAAYLLRINGWFMFISLVLMSCLNWDRLIVSHNLTHDNPGEIDVDYYLQLSPTVYPILFRNLDIVEAQMQAHLERSNNKERWLSYVEIDQFEEQLEYKTSLYLERIAKNNWPSWNYADAQLKKKTILVKD